jgi:rod shape-determining protein MreD
VIADALKAAALLFTAAIVQVSILSRISIFGGTPDLVLVTLVGVGLLRGAIFGAVAGFCVGLVVDTATFATLGFTSLLLTTAGYWIGRYGETTGRGRTRAPLLSVAVSTVLVAFGALVLHFMLGENAPARAVLVDALPPSLVLNLALGAPVFALCRRLLQRAERAPEVQLLG